MVGATVRSAEDRARDTGQGGEPEVVQRFDASDALAEGAWRVVRVPFLGAECGALVVERSARNGLQVTAEKGTVCMEGTGRPAHFVSGQTLHISHGDAPADEARSCCGHHVDQILVLPAGLAQELGIRREPGRYATVRVLVEILDGPDTPVVFIDRGELEALRRQRR